MNIKNMSNNAQFKDITKISHRKLKIQVDQIERDYSSNPYLYYPFDGKSIRIRNSFKEKVGFKEFIKPVALSRIFGQNKIYMKKNKNEGLSSMSKIPEKERDFKIISKSTPNSNMKNLSNGQWNTITLKFGNLFYKKRLRNEN